MHQRKMHKMGADILTFMVHTIYHLIYATKRKIKVYANVLFCSHFKIKAPRSLGPVYYRTIML